MGLFDRFRQRKSEELNAANSEPEIVEDDEFIFPDEEEDEFVFADEVKEKDEPIVEDEDDEYIFPEDREEKPAIESESETIEEDEYIFPEDLEEKTENLTEPEPAEEEDEYIFPDEIEEKVEAVAETPAVEENVPEIYDVGLEKTRSTFGDRFNNLLSNFRSVDEDFFENLEDTLISADVGFEMALKISDELRNEVKLQNAKKKEDVQNIIVEKLISTYENAGGEVDAQMKFAEDGQPTVFLFVGVNGVGKTTTIGKMAAVYKKRGKKVLLAAADTFRAGAVKQLQEWGQRDEVDVVAGKDKSDPASVVFDAVKKAKDENYDILFVDTAGRLQNNTNLMQELAKMKKIIERELPEAPQEVLLVLDATTGQNALQQAKLFKDSSDVTGMVLTKVDGTAKGGIILAIRQEMELPVKWLGLGEKVDDLQFFDSEEFIYGLFKDLIEI